LLAHVYHEQMKLSRRIISAVKPFAVHVILFFLVCLLTLTGSLEPLNLSLLDMRFRILERAPSDTLVVVEIDPLSLKEEDYWPWPRDHYATAIINLQNAGASLIAFDVDFSSLSSGKGDTAFVEALSRRPGEVVLPVFSQWSSSDDKKGMIVTAAPHPSFLQNVIVASVNLTTEENGLVRRGWKGFNDDDSFRASIAATLAGTPSADQESFYIDYGVDLSKIERLSFSDVLRGNIPVDVVQGKNILIGATAVELGDEYAAPNLGVIPGVMLHALSYESLLQGRAIKRLHYYIPLIAALIIIFWVCRESKNKSWRKIITGQLVLFAGLVGAPVILQALTPISFDIGSIVAAQGLSITYIVGLTLHRHTQQIFIQRRATARYQALTNLVVRDNTDGVIIADPHGVIELCNDRANDLLGASQAMAPGAHIQSFAENFPLYPSVKEPVQYSIAGLDDDQPVLCEYQVKGTNGLMLEIVASRSSQNLSTDGRADDKEPRQVFVYTLRDISARKRIEAAEKATKQAAVAANKFKSELIANMSHELRTPLNGVIGFADILQKESFGPLGVPEYKEYSEHIHVSGKRLLGLVNDMLSIAKLDSGDYEINKSQIPIDEVIENCLIPFENNEMRKTINVVFQQNMPSLNVDHSVIKEILTHLISNAMKYTDDNAEISLSVEDQSGDLVIEVKDNGCGVDPELLPQLTKVFYQANGALNRKHEGAGLGLYLASKLAALHGGGTLEFESEKGVGFLARLRLAGIISKRQKDAA
jgi:signal transduction histidine kinase/CHASE2 domain-containing sensor protein